MKKYLKIENVIVLLFVISHILVKREYEFYTSLFFIVIMLPLLIIKFIKERKEDQLNGTNNFRSSLIKMLFILFILIVGFFILKIKP